MSRLCLGLVGLSWLLCPAAGLGQGTPERARRVADIASLALEEYQLGVQAGRVVSPAELEEARLFLEEARRSAEGLPGGAAGAAVALLDTLIAGVRAHQPVERLAPIVAALRAHLSAALGVELDPVPTNPPTLARGRELYAARCASCHGDVGRGDGPAAAGLVPPPADLTAPALRGSSPLEFYRKINVGVAVDLEDALVVPVIPDADGLNVTGLARRIDDLVGRARGGGLTADDVSGGTFTVTSIGSIGGLFSYPVIHPPEAAILGLHKIVRRPVVRGGEIVERDMMYLSLSFDHRLIDGGTATRFMNDVILQIEALGTE